MTKTPARGSWPSPSTSTWGKPYFAASTLLTPGWWWARSPSSQVSIPASQADLAKHREQKRWCGELMWVWSTVGLHGRKEEAVGALEGQERSRLQWILFRLITDGHVQKHNQGNQKLDCRAFLLFETVACCLWGWYFFFFPTLYKYLVWVIYLQVLIKLARGWHFSFLKS